MKKKLWINLIEHCCFSSILKLILSIINLSKLKLWTIFLILFMFQCNYLILDISSVTHVDSAACQGMIEVNKHFGNVGLTLILAGIRGKSNICYQQTKDHWRLRWYLNSYFLNFVCFPLNILRCTTRVENPGDSGGIRTILFCLFY